MATEPQTDSEPTTPQQPPATLAQALVEFQRTCPTVGRSRNGQAGSRTYKYATLEAIWEAIQKPLTNAGLAVHQATVPDGPGVWLLKTVILHGPTGDRLETVSPIVYSAGTAQQFGSALSYSRRYSLCAALGVVVEDEDDDGTAASQKAQPPPQQATQPRQQAQGTKAPPQRQQAAQPPAQQAAPPQREAKAQPPQQEAKPEDVQAVQILYKNYLDELIHAGYKDAGTLAHRHFREFCNGTYGTTLKPGDQLRSALTGSIPVSILAMATPQRPYPWQPDEIVFQKDDLTILPDEENRPVGF